MRPVSRGPTAQDHGNPILTLPCFDQVRERLLSGWSVPSVAKFIREDQHQLTNYTEQTVCLLLYKYRKTLPPAELLQKAEEILPKQLTKVHKVAEERMKNGLNELDEFEKLYALQLDRIGRGMAEEKANNKISSAMSTEFRIAKEILESSAGLKMDLGLSKRHIGTVQAEARLVEDVEQRYGSQAVARVLADPQARQRLATVAQRFVLAGANASVLSSVLANTLPAQASPVIDVESSETVIEEETNAPEAVEELIPESVEPDLAEIDALLPEG